MNTKHARMKCDSFDERDGSYLWCRRQAVNRQDTTVSGSFHKVLNVIDADNPQKSSSYYQDTKL